MQERGLDLEFVEQPVKAHDFDGLKYVTERSYVPVLADESVFSPQAVSYTHLRAHETDSYLVCRLLLEKKKQADKKKKKKKTNVTDTLE